MSQALALGDPDAESLRKVLKLERFFPGRLSAAKLQRVFPNSRLLEYDAGERIIAEGERSSDIYVVQAGSVSITRSMGTAGAPLATLGEGEIFGEMAFLGAGVRSASAAAAGPCRVFRLSAQDLQALVGANPELGQHLTELARRRSKP